MEDQGADQWKGRETSWKIQVQINGKEERYCRRSRYRSSERRRDIMEKDLRLAGENPEVGIDGDRLYLQH